MTSSERLHGRLGGLGFIGNSLFQYLENLDGLKKLRVLSVSNHMVEKMEKLDKLTQLRELDLSYNCISKIEGLDSLVHLQVLNLSGNGIEHIPAGLFKKLREVQAFHIAHNRLDSVSMCSEVVWYSVL